MIKNILVVPVALVITLLVSFQMTSKALGQDRPFSFVGQRQGAVEGGVISVFHPQAREERSGLFYDISSQSNLDAVCWNMGFSRRAAGAQFMESQIHRAVVVDRNGNVIAKVNSGLVIGVLHCFVN